MRRRIAQTFNILPAKRHIFTRAHRVKFVDTMNDIRLYTFTLHKVCVEEREDPKMDYCFCEVNSEDKVIIGGGMFLTWCALVRTGCIGSDIFARVHSSVL